MRDEGSVDVSNSIPVDTVEEGMGLDLINVETRLGMIQETIAV